MIFCEFRRASVSAIVTAIMMLMIAATALKITMHILLVDAFDEFYLLLVEFFEPACVLE